MPKGNSPTLNELAAS